MRGEVEMARRITMELSAVVECDGAKVSVETFDGATHDRVGLLYVPGDELLDNKEASDSLDQCQDTVALVGAANVVVLPMS